MIPRQAQEQLARSPEQNTLAGEPDTPTGNDSMRTEPAKTVTNYVVFQSVDWKNGEVVTGWRFNDNTAEAPDSQWCYYQWRDENGLEPTIPLGKKITDSAIAAAGLTPLEYDEAQSKCVWFNGLAPAK